MADTIFPTTKTAITDSDYTINEDDRKHVVIYSPNIHVRVEQFLYTCMFLSACTYVQPHIMFTTSGRTFNFRHEISATINLVTARRVETHLLSRKIRLRSTPVWSWLSSTQVARLPEPVVTVSDIEQYLAGYNIYCTDWIIYLKSAAYTDSPETLRHRLQNPHPRQSKLLQLLGTTLNTMELVKYTTVVTGRG